MQQLKHKAFKYSIWSKFIFSVLISSGYESIKCSLIFRLNESSGLLTKTSGCEYFLFFWIATFFQCNESFQFSSTSKISAIMLDSIKLKNHIFNLSIQCCEVILK